MGKFLSVLCLFVTIQLSGQETAKQIFESPDLGSIISTHKTVAILPYTAKISYRRPPKNFDEAQHQAEEKSLGTSL
jgi:hypothetical protein